MNGLRKWLLAFALGVLVGCGGAYLAWALQSHEAARWLVGGLARFVSRTAWPLLLLWVLVAYKKELTTWIDDLIGRMRKGPGGLELDERPKRFEPTGVSIRSEVADREAQKTE